MPMDKLRELVEEVAQASPISAADRHDLEAALQMLTAAKPECRDYLWKHFVFGLAHGEIAEEENLSYDDVRMKIGRGPQAAQALLAA
jgi:DNA-directed RNA polymerase specialized sigma24 family protein